MAFLKKWGLKVILPCALALIALIVLLVCFCGLRGIYVCVDDPSIVISFGVGEYDVITGETMLHGEYKLNGRIIETNTELPSELTGDTVVGESAERNVYKARDLFEKLDGYDRISIGGKVFERVSLIKLQDNVSKVNIRFDMGGVKPSEFENPNASSIPIGGYVEAPGDPVADGDVFLGWYTAPYGSDDAEPVTSFGSRVWKDTVYYAWWASQA